MFKNYNAKISINQGYGKIIRICLFKTKKRHLDALIQTVVNK